MNLTARSIPERQAPAARSAPRHRKAELRVLNSVHDQLQLESSSHFDLLPEADEERRRYKIDAYMFIPVSIGVNSDNYKRDSFFKHLTSHYRIRTPRCERWLDIGPEEFRLEAAERYFAVHLSTYERRRLAALVVQEAKLFGSFMHTRIKKLLKYVRRYGQAPPGDREPRLDYLRRRTLHAVALTDSFRTGYIRRIREQPLVIENEVRRAFLLADEYISYRLEFVLIRLCKGLREMGGAQDLQDFAEERLRNEVGYREHHQMLCLHSAPDQTRRLEVYTYRLGLLKKYISDVLFLKVTDARKDLFYRNAAAAVGAGIAATFWGLAEQQRLQYLKGDDSAFRLAILILAAVVAYIFKDRIKELTREFFNERLKHKLPDDRVELAYPYVDPTGKRRAADIGTAQEFMRYLKEDSLPAEILYLRDLEHRSHVDPGRNEVVLHYARQMDFRLRATADRADFRYIKHVMRYDFSEFLAKLDDPAKAVHYFDAQEGARVAQAPKVYHVNILLRYETLYGGEDRPMGRRIDFERIRVILNKRGIVRLETVIPGGEMAYLEGPNERP